jgi:hypothetical protein
MFAVSQLGGLVLLAIVLYEVQSAIRAVIFAIDWPADVRIARTSQGITRSTGAPLTRRQRVAIALYRLAYDSLFLHEIHSLRVMTPAAFRTVPSIAFGAVVMVSALGFAGLTLGVSANLGICAASVMFVSSQARSFAKFHAMRSAQSKELKVLFESLKA